MNTNSPKDKTIQAGIGINVLVGQSCAMAISVAELPIQFTAFTFIATIAFIIVKKRKALK